MFLINTLAAFVFDSGAHKDEFAGLIPHSGRHWVSIAMEAEFSLIIRYPEGPQPAPDLDPLRT